MEYLGAESGSEPDAPADQQSVPSQRFLAASTVHRTARQPLGFRGARAAWAYLIVRLALVWTGFSALLIPGALLWGQVAPSEGQIAYISRHGAWGEIRVIDMRTRIAHSIIRLIDLDQIAWSHNGAFAFTIRYGERSHITVSDQQGRAVRQLTDDSGFDTNLAWSPDGLWLAFQSSNPRGTDIYVIDPHGNQARQLTNAPDFDGDPTWSPDGRRIAFRSDRSGSSDLYVMDVDGKNVLRLTDNREREERPAWSPDGKYVAFASYGSNNWDLYVVEVVSGKVRRLTDSLARDHLPTWSPDGRRLAFESNRDGQVGIYVLDLNDGHVALVAGGSQGSYFPIWRP